MGRLDSVGFLLKKKVKKRPSKGTSFWGESGEGLNPSDLFLSLRSRSNEQIHRPHTKMKKKNVYPMKTSWPNVSDLTFGNLYI